MGFGGGGEGTYEGVSHGKLLIDTGVGVGVGGWGRRGRRAVSCWAALWEYRRSALDASQADSLPSGFQECDHRAQQPPTPGPRPPHLSRHYLRNTIPLARSAPNQHKPNHCSSCDHIIVTKKQVKAHVYECLAELVGEFSADQVGWGWASWLCLWGLGVGSFEGWGSGFRGWGFGVRG